MKFVHTCNVKTKMDFKVEDLKDPEGIWTVEKEMVATLILFPMIV